MLISFNPVAPSIGIDFSILPAAISITTIFPRSATYNLPLNIPMPFGPCKPLTHSAAITLPSRPTLPIEPLPSAFHGSVPSILLTYKTCAVLSNNTDSGTFRVLSLSHLRTSSGVFAESACSVVFLSLEPPQAARKSTPKNNISFIVLILIKFKGTKQIIGLQIGKGIITGPVNHLV